MGAVLAAAPGICKSILSQCLANGKREEENIAMARPLREEAPLVHDLKFRVDEKTFRELTLYCEMTGNEKSQVIRKSLKIFLARQFSIV